MRHLGTSWKPAPADYWKHWQTECELSDLIMVNSPWSQKALEESGVPQEKIRVVPLAYEQEQAAPARRSVPTQFSESRPLRVLFLGQINLRKGAHLLLEAAEALKASPMEFWMVGPSEIPADSYAANPKVKWIGPVNRSKASEFYREADVFILPTLSDGFALTQLEAQAWGLPVIASPYCGEVVQQDVNGHILDSLDTAGIVNILHQLVAEPMRLQTWADNSRIHERFSLGSLSRMLKECEDNWP